MKSALGAVAEVVTRLKTNGHLREYSPASRMIELEMLAAGITTKRNLWRALRTTTRPGLATDDLDRLIARATSQLAPCVSTPTSACRRSAQLIV